MVIPCVVILMGWAAAAAWAQKLPAPIEQAMKRAGLPVDHVGLIVLPAAGGAPLLAVNADQPLNPASTMKLVTSFAALSTLGPDYRWRTNAYLKGALDGEVLEGDLVLRGGGDPKFVIEDLTEFVARMRSSGLRIIRGNLLIDDSLYDIGDDSVDPIDGDPSQPYNVRPHAMMMNFKATRFVLRPEGKTVALTLDPPLADLALDTEVRAAPGRCRFGASGLYIRDGGTQFKPLVKVSGSYSLSCGEQSTFVAILSHRQYIHAFFKAAWVAAGGQWEGQTLLARGASEGLVPWQQWVSPRTLMDVVQDINKFSNNVMTRQVLLQMAAEKDKAPARLDRARQVVGEWLEQQGMKFGELVIDNGSGLSRQERISARHLATVLQRIAASPLADGIRLSLPAVGVDGTMRNRLVRDPLAGSAWIKTGSLNDVRAIAGYVDAASGRRMIVVMLINGQRAELSQGAQDAVLRWVHANG